MSTRPPVSQPVDHARWADERERRLRGEGTTIKVHDPILDSRWAVIFGGTLWLLLATIMAWIGNSIAQINSKMDSQIERLSAQGSQQRVLEVRFDALESKVDSYGNRIDRLERIRNASGNQAAADER